jgi:hypothetical protein
LVEPTLDDYDHFSGRSRRAGAGHPGAVTDFRATSSPAAVDGADASSA